MVVARSNDEVRMLSDFAAHISPRQESADEVEKAARAVSMTSLV